MTTTLPIGWVLRSSTIGFIVGCRVLQPNVPQFGDLVKVASGEEIHIFGLIYDVQVQDDPAVRQLIMVGEMEPETVLDQRENRLVPIEIGILIVGYERRGQMVQGLPPQPPLSLDMLILCSDSEIQTFTEDLSYLRLVFNTAQIPADEVIVTNLTRAAAARPPEIRRQFLIGAGRELARLLNMDVGRLDSMLRRIKPV